MRDCLGDFSFGTRGSMLEILEGCVCLSREVSVCVSLMVFSNVLWLVIGLPGV